MAKQRLSSSGFFTKPTTSIILVLLICMFSAIYYTLYIHKQSQPIDYPRFHDLFLAAATNSTLASYLRDLTRQPHLAGTSRALRTANYVKSHFSNLGLETEVAEYSVLLSYPKHASLEVRFGNGTARVFKLVEPGYDDGVVVVPYHAYSPSGSVVAGAVYVNFGREEDYKALEAMGVSVKGCVVVVRRDGLSRGGAAEIAAGRGAAAVLMYTEEGREEGVERGTVMVGGLGDPLTPGWAAVEGGERLGVEDDEVLKRFPKIPSLPISARVAVEILGLLGGPEVPKEWMGRLTFRGSGVGPGPVMLNLTYLGEKKVASIQNVFAIIRGSEEPDRYILLGNHRDAWTYGAVDPNSGTAALLDIARRYALLMQLGWRPRRTIILCSWDAEEFGMIGSTEWVEQNLLRLRSNGVAYLNVDCAVQGSGFSAAATPQLDDVLIEVTKKVHSPYSDGLTVFEQWSPASGITKVQRLTGAYSDFAPFLQHVGIPSADIFYGQVAPVYHTAYDSYEWMMSSGDPMFQRHVAGIY
uniref:glutamate carboxypeptidase II n=1 Tax=Kalanchoe fedtschenkoi TaxID=63787 RepID=A0A7N0VHE6_KALFE